MTNIYVIALLKSSLSPEVVDFALGVLSGGVESLPKE